MLPVGLRRASDSLGSPQGPSESPPQTGALGPGSPQTGQNDAPSVTAGFKAAPPAWRDRSGENGPPTNDPALPTPPADSTYRPGVCNIGPEEIARRRRAAIAASVFTAAVAGCLLLADLPQIARLAIFPFAAAAGVSWLQVIRRFCVAFGAAGVLNFGALGSTERVANDEARATDRRIALRMILEGSAYGLLITLGFLVLPA